MRTLMIGFSATTAHWPQPKKPNASFRWEQADKNYPATIADGHQQVLKITVPRSFRDGQLRLTLGTTGGRLTALAIPAAGIKAEKITGTDDRTVVIPLVANQLDFNNHAFTVRLTADQAPVTVKTVELKIRR